MASPGRVLIIVQNLPVPFDRRVWLEATALCKSGYEVSVICPKGKHGAYQASHEVLEGVHIFRYHAPPDLTSVFGYLFEFIYCWLVTAVLSIKVLFQRNFNVIHACNPPETYFALGLVYKAFGKKFIFDHHDLSPEMYLAKGGRRGGVFHRGLLWLERQTFRAANVVITTNLSHKKIAESRGAVEPERVFVVRSGPDPDRLESLPPEMALKEGYRYLACYLGEMCPQDGVDYLLQAIHTYTCKLGFMDTKFILMGSGPSFEDLRKLRSELGLEKVVEFTGRVSDHDLCRYLSTADICLDPDPYSEWSDQSTMNKIMEYMAFGKPIVAFDLKENRFSAQEAAVYAKCNDTLDFAKLIRELLDDPERRERMGAVGLNRLRNNLAWKYSVPHLLAAYQKVFS
jgi:glycosyltransferase involved in cell wall biosynthesis